MIMEKLFVIQEHDAKVAKLHWDLRFEADGELITYLGMRTDDTSEPMENTSKVLRSFAIPKHRLPEMGEKLLAVPTENHPWSYRTFEGVIPSGYGAGTVKLLFSDYIEVEALTQDRVKFTYQGAKYVMFPWRGQKNWFIARIA